MSDWWIGDEKSKQQYILELEQQLEKESFYARKQKALRVEANSKLAELREAARDALAALLEEK